MPFAFFKFDRLTIGAKGLKFFANRFKELAMDKKELRKKLYEKRKVVFEEHPENLALLQDRISQWLECHEFSCVGFYRAFRHEPDITNALLHWSNSSQGQLAVPRVDDMHDGRMHFCLWSADMPMVKGAFGIEEPALDNPVCPDVIFSPCVGVNPEGFRLGNGGGFFDRYLDERRSIGNAPVTVAVAFDELIVQDSYQQSHDIAFDWIVTQSGFVSTKSRRA